jgi:hypothetical protein
MLRSLSLEGELVILQAGKTLSDLLKESKPKVMFWIF